MPIRASANAARPASRNAADSVKSAICEIIGVSDDSPVPSTCTAGFGNDPARSAEVTTSAPPPSVTRQHSSKWNG